MKKINDFTSRYPLSKTLRFKLIPVGKTLENFNANRLLDDDKDRNDNYQEVKKLIDKYHRYYIESVLSNYKPDNAIIDEYVILYHTCNKEEFQKDRMLELESLMRKQISKVLCSDNRYSRLGKKEMIKELLPNFLTDESELKLVNEFKDFTTYFTGFFKNRDNMYSAEPKSTAISYRCINENLPKFIDNINIYSKKNMAEILKTEIEALNADFVGIYGINVSEMFTTDYFAFVLSQSGIDKYNSVIGGYTCSDGTKVKGLNEYINQYNQQVAKSDKTKRLPQLNHLFKQILSEGDTISFVDEKFETDFEVLDAIGQYYSAEKDESNISFEDAVKKIKEIFAEIESFDANGIFVKNGIELTSVCSGAFGFWGTVESAWNLKYDEQSRFKNKQDEKYIEKRQNVFKKTGSFSISEIQKLAELTEKESNKINAVTSWLKEEICQNADTTLKEYSALKPMLESIYISDKKLFENNNAILLIKNALDSVKMLEKKLQLVLGTGKEETKDEVFYGDFLPYYQRICQIDRLYDRVRNYMTKKPYKTDKIKLNFNNYQLLGGWDRNKESEYSSVLLRKNDKYYLAVMSKANNKLFENIPSCDGNDVYQKMIYKLFLVPIKCFQRYFFQKKV